MKEEIVIEILLEVHQAGKDEDFKDKIGILMEPITISDAEKKLEKDVEKFIDGKKPTHEQGFHKVFGDINYNHDNKDHQAYRYATEIMREEIDSKTTFDEWKSEYIKQLAAPLPGTSNEVTLDEGWQILANGDEKFIKQLISRTPNEDIVESGVPSNYLVIHPGVGGNVDLQKEVDNSIATALELNPNSISLLLVGEVGQKQAHWSFIAIDPRNKEYRYFDPEGIEMKDPLKTTLDNNSQLKGLEYRQIESLTAEVQKGDLENCGYFTLAIMEQVSKADNIAARIDVKEMRDRMEVIKKNIVEKFYIKAWKEIREELQPSALNKTSLQEGLNPVSIPNAGVKFEKANRVTSSRPKSSSRSPQTSTEATSITIR